MSHSVGESKQFERAVESVAVQKEAIDIKRAPVAPLCKRSPASSPLPDVSEQASPSRSGPRSQDKVFTTDVPAHGVICKLTDRFSTGRTGEYLYLYHTKPDTGVNDPELNESREVLPGRQP
ncbi:hypothetical protein CC2G_011626 [Coprinopsis cinerea AmutBmut pab1-1]|nr:hypothetical protein CC2G_011626 [Coprinopsis cinerea AmutBmut pab1-1]